jgi:predicted kinase
MSAVKKFLWLDSKRYVDAVPASIVRPLAKDLNVPKCYQLIGVPCAGKSTWTKSQQWILGIEYVSTDHHVEAYAKSVGKTYSEVFREFMPRAVELMAQEVVDARTAGRDVIWDQTSTTISSRTRKFNMLPDYYHIAVVFPTPEIALLKERLACRPGKEIPWEVVQGMIDNFEYPTEDEGFKEIWRI